MRPKKRKMPENTVGPEGAAGTSKKKKNRWQNIDLSIPRAESRRRTGKIGHTTNTLSKKKNKYRKKSAFYMKAFRNRGVDKSDKRPRIERIRVALEGLSSGRYQTISEAAKSNGVHYDQIQRRAQGKVKWYRRNGPEPVLSLGEERHLAQWMIKMGKKGVPVTPRELQDTVQKAIRTEGRRTPFRNGRPSYGWYGAFLERNPEIKDQVLDKPQAKVHVRVRAEPASESDTEPESECSCPICGEIYDESLGVAWIGCDSCDQWFHISCMPKVLVKKKMLRKKEWYCLSCTVLGERNPDQQNAEEDTMVSS